MRIHKVFNGEMKEHIFRQYRERHGLSQAEFGKLLGLERSPQGLISHWETGRQSVPIATAYKFIAMAKIKGERFSLEDVYPLAMASGSMQASGTKG